MELDPWAKNKRPRKNAPREPAVPMSRITGYVIAFIMVGVVAVASFEMLVLA